MNKLVVYYSYTGNTKKIAEKLAKKESADVTQIKEIKPQGKFKAYTVGSYAALKGKACEIQPLDKDLNAYENIIVLAPVWADNPAPAANAVWQMLPAGKKVKVIMVSASGKSKCRERIEKLITARGCDLVGFEDLKS